MERRIYEYNPDESPLVRLEKMFENVQFAQSMADTYWDRLVEHTDGEDFQVDTTYVTDRVWKYETAVIKKGFNDNNYIIVESAETKEEAKKVHDKWVEKMGYGVHVLTDIFTGWEYRRD